MTTKPKKKRSVKPTRVRTTRPAKHTRSAISGRYGGAKEVEALARRIAAASRASFRFGHTQASLVGLIKAELFSATTVEERVERVLWRGWASTGSDGKLYGIVRYALFDHRADAAIDGEGKPVRVLLVMDR